MTAATASMPPASKSKMVRRFGTGGVSHERGLYRSKSEPVHSRCLTLIDGFRVKAQNQNGPAAIIRICLLSFSEENVL